MIDTPVLIAGGGPVGTTLALDLASRGTDCMVVEQRREQPPNPRCNTTNARSMEFFRRLGIADEIRAAGLPGDHPTDVVYLTQWTGHELTRYRLPPSAMARTASGTVDEGWPTPEPQHRICQIYLEPILRRHAQTMPGLEFREGWRFDSYRPSADGISATIRNLDTGETEEVRARFLVGAEGAHSIVRATMGASFEGKPRVARTLSTFIRCPRLGELNDSWRGWMFVCPDGTPPPPFSLGAYEPTSWPGIRTPHLWLDNGGSLYDAFADQFTLLILGAAEPQHHSLTEAAKRRRLPLDVVAIESDAALETYEGYPLVLVRPDQHVAWRGREAPRDAAAALAVIDRVRGAGTQGAEGAGTQGAEGAGTQGAGGASREGKERRWQRITSERLRSRCCGSNSGQPLTTGQS